MTAVRIPSTWMLIWKHRKIYQFNKLQIYTKNIIKLKTWEKTPLILVVTKRMKSSTRYSHQLFNIFGHVELQTRLLHRRAKKEEVSHQTLDQTIKNQACFQKVLVAIRAQRRVNTQWIQVMKSKKNHLDKIALAALTWERWML